LALLFSFNYCKSVSIDKTDLITFNGKGFTSFQVEEFRLYLLNPPMTYSSCENIDLYHLCEKGILNRKMFWMEYEFQPAKDSLQMKVKDESKILNNNFKRWKKYSISSDSSLSKDLESFNGRIIFVEEFWIEKITSNTETDSIEIGMTVDLTEKLPGPMRIYTLKLLCDYKSNPSKGIWKNPHKAKLYFNGWIL